MAEWREYTLMRRPPSMAYLHVLLSLFGVLWIALARRPHDRTVWLAENSLTALTVATLLATYQRWPLESLSYSLTVVFLVLHTIGGHFTYVRVPYDRMAFQLFGREINKTFGWVRNHYDRLVHFCYGLLMAYPFFDMLQRYATPAEGWSYFLSPALIMATSMIFEVLEWWAAALLSKDQGAAYLGAQGDEWDAQKDMGLAALGSIFAMFATWLMF